MKRLCGIILALAGLFLYGPCAAQNTRVYGTVTDAQTGEPIPYAVVLFPGTTTGTTTDDEGCYSIENRDTSSYIRAEMVSYEPQIRPIPAGSDNRVDFRLNPTHLEIGNVVVTPGDNPAHPILAGIVRNKNTTIRKNTTATSAAPIRKWNSAWPMSGNFEAENSSKTSVSFSSTSTHRMSPDNPTCL